MLLPPPPPYRLLKWSLPKGQLAAPVQEELLNAALERFQAKVSKESPFAVTCRLLKQGQVGRQATYPPPAASLP